jgi:outer membrane protein
LRQKLGRSRKSEVLAAQAQRAQIDAELATVRARGRQAQLALRFLTGLDEDILPAPQIAVSSEPLELWLEAAARRPDVEAARLESQALALGVSVARRQRWPVLSLDGNYYLKRPPGFTEKVSWDAVLRAELPLYSGGGVTARIKAAEAQRRSAEASRALAGRKAVLETESAYALAQSAASIVGALEKAAELAEANAKAQEQDYGLGLVTNLEVLGSLNALQESRLKLAEAKLNSVLARARLLVAAGAVEEGP